MSVSYEHPSDPLSDEEKRILKPMEDCYFQRGCRVVRRLAAHAMLNDGILYSGTWQLRRLLYGFSNLEELAGEDCERTCENGCRFENAVINGIRKEQITFDQPTA